ncbi:MAG TPA: HPr family phosphocarrier protein [Candidatus Omnitrophica bacterium]|nr:HPr family phosphocarrier protein [Candidatus Omnitrophota bacterium]
MKVKKKMQVKSRLGLHARPAAMFVETANRFLSKIKVRKDDLVVDGKSILNILMLGVEYGDEIEVEAEGQDANEAITALQEIVDKEDV